jgi:hypothetical protein
MSALKIIAAMLISVVAFASCSDGSDTTSASGTDPCGPQGCPFDYTNYDGMGMAAVSFDADVLPVMRRACGFSACHGTTVGSKAGLYLGPSLMAPAPDTMTKQAIINGLVNTPSSTAMAMNRITANDPEQSFLMLKLDGCHTTAGLTCTLQGSSMPSDSCGQIMPPGGQSLCADERDLFRRWISQGAQNN